VHGNTLKHAAYHHNLTPLTLTPSQHPPRVDFLDPTKKHVFSLCFNRFRFLLHYNGLKATKKLEKIRKTNTILLDVILVRNVLDISTFLVKPPNFYAVFLDFSTSR
jgi:hypothetical protein